MGTSTVDRSPNTLPWSIVNSMYRNPEVTVTDVLREVFRAGGLYGSHLGDDAVRNRVRVFLQAVERGTWREGTAGALAASREAVREAQAATLESNTASFFGDLADRALHTTLLLGAREPQRLDSSGAALEAFTTSLIRVAVDHLISRDITRHLRSRRLPRASDAVDLRRRLVDGVGDVIASPNVRELLTSAAPAAPDNWPDIISEVWQEGEDLGSRDPARHT